MKQERLLPFYTSEAFPKELMRYSLPLVKAAQGQETVVLLSVDWEKDHGRWRSGLVPSYTGIRLASQPLCQLLDRLGIPCTWFVEANGVHPELDMPTACQDQLQALASRTGDEIGLHVHWGNFSDERGGPISLQDRQWVAKEVSASTTRLRNITSSPVTTFRSGGHTLVPGLPRILQELGYRADLSVEDRRPPTLRYLQGLFGYGCGPYHLDGDFANQRGDLCIQEIPTSLHLHDFARLDRRLSRFLVRGCVNVLSIYIHIDELTQPRQNRLDYARLTGVELILKRLSQFSHVEFQTVSTYLDKRGR